MENCNRELVLSIRHTSPAVIRSKLKSESQNELTISIVNLLYNIVVTQVIPTNQAQRSYFNEHSDLIWKILATKTSLKAKKTLLEENPKLVKVIATACPDW